MITLPALIEILCGGRRSDIDVELVQDCEPDGTGYRVYELRISADAIPYTGTWTHKAINLQVSLEEIE